MKDRPILFSASMVQAILDGGKTQTRRVVKFRTYGIDGLTGQLAEHAEMQKVYPMPKGGFVFWSGNVTKEYSDLMFADDDGGVYCHYGQPGDRLWVRETWALRGNLFDTKIKELPYVGILGAKDKLVYRASEQYPDAGYFRWRPSIFMPRWASRITLEIVNIRVERVNRISEEDARAEGAPTLTATSKGGQQSHQLGFMALWDVINAKRGFPWKSNPWVWVIEFRRLS